MSVGQAVRALKTPAIGLKLSGRWPVLAAFWTFLFVLPLEHILAVRIGLTLSPGYIALLVLLAAVLVTERTCGLRGSLGSPLARYVIGYVAVAALSVVMTFLIPPPEAPPSLGVRASELRSAIQIAFLVFCSSAFFVVRFLTTDPKRLRAAFAATLLAASLVALYALYQLAAVRLRLPFVDVLVTQYFESPASLRPNGTFVEPMQLGHYLTSALPLGLALFFGRSRLRASERATYGWPFALPLAIMGAALLATVARGPWLGMACALVVLFVLMPWRTRFVLAGGGALALIALLALGSWIYGSPATVVEIIASRFRPTATNIVNEQRLWYFQFLIELFRQYPILGVGYGNYALYQVAAFDLYGIAGAFGVYWQALVETGAVGFATLIAMFGAYIVIMVRAIRRASTSEWHPYLVGCLASMIAVMVGHLFMGDRLNLYTWSLLGLSMAAVHAAEVPE